MKVNITHKIWENAGSILAQQDIIDIDGHTLGQASSNLVYEMRRRLEKDMLKRLTIGELEAMSQSINDVLIDKVANGDERDNIPLTAEELPIECLIDDKLTKEQTYEIVENYVEYHCRLAQEMIQEAANDSLNIKTMLPYIEDLTLLLKFKEVNSTLLYHRFMEEDADDRE